MIKDNIKLKVDALPLSSGVYLMKDAGGRVIYVGKAVSLRKRVQSYFRATTAHLKTDYLVADIADIEHVHTASEAEALILEASLVKEHQPKYNVELKDDKSYPYIQITKERFPLVSVLRMTSQEAKERKAVYYGPYVNAALIREALDIIRKIFPFRTCDPLPKEKCLYHDIGLCDAPCIAAIEDKSYQRNIRNLVLILEGKKDELYEGLRKDMEQLSADHHFEQAARVRDQMRAIGALYSGTKDINYYKETEQLQRMLNLPKRPERIECFDISNIMGNQTVAAMVSFLNGKPDKTNYRKFKIRQTAGIDDFKSIGEVVRRRYRRLQTEGKTYPDLIIIDGGKGQLSAACHELKVLGVEIPIMALAKQEEEVFLPKRRSSVVLPKDSLALKLLQRVRDEAHRFAITYHKLLRTKAAFGTEKSMKQLMKSVKHVD